MDPIFRCFTIIVSSEEAFFRGWTFSNSSRSSLCNFSLCCTSCLRFTGFYEWFQTSIWKGHTILIRLKSRSEFSTDWFILSIWSCVRTPGLSSASCAMMSRISLQFNPDLISNLLHLFKEGTGRDVCAGLIFEIFVLQVFDCKQHAVTKPFELNNKVSDKIAHRIMAFYTISIGIIRLLARTNNAIYR